MLFIKECAKNAYWARSALPAGQMPFCWDIGVNHNIQHTKNRSFQLLQKNWNEIDILGEESPVNKLWFDTIR